MSQIRLGSGFVSLTHVRHSARLGELAAVAWNCVIAPWSILPPWQLTSLVCKEVTSSPRPRYRTR
jgi:hypothetical protein